MVSIDRMSSREEIADPPLQVWPSGLRVVDGGSPGWRARSRMAVALASVCSIRAKASPRVAAAPVRNDDADRWEMPRIPRADTSSDRLAMSSSPVGTAVARSTPDCTDVCSSQWKRADRGRRCQPGHDHLRRRSRLRAGRSSDIFVFGSGASGLSLPGLRWMAASVGDELWPVTARADITVPSASPLSAYTCVEAETGARAGATRRERFVPCGRARPPTERCRARPAR